MFAEFLDTDVAVADAGARQQERVLADVDLLAGMQRQHDDLAGLIARERDPARARRDRDQMWQVEETALGSLQRHQLHRHRVLLPQHDVVLEVDLVARRERDLDDRHQLAFDLTRARIEPDLGRVAQPRCASRQPDSLTDVLVWLLRVVELAALRGIVVLITAPLAGDPRVRVHGRRHIMSKLVSRDRCITATRTRPGIAACSASQRTAAVEHEHVAAARGER